MARENKKGQFTTEVKKTKDAAKVSNDKEVAEKALAEIQKSFAEEIKKASDYAFSLGVERGRIMGFQDGERSGQKKGRKTALSIGLIIGGSVAIIAAFIAIGIAGKI